jgi:tRNA threonylcarbamoyl adenosine modification protein YjeE
VTIEYVIHTVDQMHAWGERLGAQLQPGDVVVLSGELGAGKTTLTKGIASGLGVEDRVTSPTFVIVHEHPGRDIRLIHVDAYRLAGPGEFDDLDIGAGDAALVIEWGADIAPHRFDNWLHIIITALDSGDRTLVCRGVGARWQPGVWPC